MQRHDFGSGEFIYGRVYAKDIRKMPPGSMIRMVWKDSVLGEVWALYRITEDHRMQNMNHPESIIPIKDRPFKVYVMVEDGERWEERLTGGRREN